MFQHWFYHQCQLPSSNVPRFPPKPHFYPPARHLDRHLLKFGCESLGLIVSMLLTLCFGYLALSLTSPMYLNSLKPCPLVSSHLSLPHPLHCFFPFLTVLWSQGCTTIIYIDPYILPYGSQNEYELLLSTVLPLLLTDLCSSLYHQHPEGTLFCHTPNSTTFQFPP